MVLDNGVTFIIAGVGAERCALIAENNANHPESRELLPDTAQIYAVADEDSAIQIECEAEGTVYTEVFELCELGLLVLTGKNIENGHENLPQKAIVAKALATLDEMLQQVRTDGLRENVERSRSAEQVCYWLNEQRRDRRLYAQEYLIDLAEMKWSIDPPGPQIDIVDAVHRDGVAIVFYAPGDAYVPRPLTDLWLESFHAESKADLTEEQRALYATWSAELADLVG
jgi:hypothetical protein